DTVREPAGMEARDPARMSQPASAGDPIDEQYRRNDAFLGEVVSRLREGDLLMVLSDHGFNAFRRGVNLNRWLLDHGYLALRRDRDGRAEWLEDVDWSRTRAYALGLTRIFLNVQGRQAPGIGEAGEEAARIKRGLVAGLTALVDRADGGGDAGGGDAGGFAGTGSGGCDDVRVSQRPIHAVFDTRLIYDGP